MAFPNKYVNGRLLCQTARADACLPVISCLYAKKSWCRPFLHLLMGPSRKTSLGDIAYPQGDSAYPLRDNSHPSARNQRLGQIR